MLSFMAPAYKSTHRVFQCSEDDCSIYDDGKMIVYDREVVDYALNHMRLLDRLDRRKVARATLVSHEILGGDLKPPTKNWHFTFK